MSFHPATLLLVWGGLVILLQTLSVMSLAVSAMVLLPLSLLLAGRRVLSLMGRARWLILSITLLFVLATPGERIPSAVGDIGVTYDGLLLAAEHVLRLVLLLATLAVLHERLGNAGLIAGLHWLLAPLGGWRELRERIVVRLLLVLEYVETSAGGGWRGWLTPDVSGQERLSLATRPARAIDWTVLVLLTIAGVWLGWSR